MQQVHARLGLLESKGNAAPEPEGTGGRQQPGISVQALTPELATQMGLRRGAQGLVVQDVDPSGPAAEAGLKSGDVILEAIVKRSGPQPKCKLRFRKQVLVRYCCL